MLTGEKQCSTCSTTSVASSNVDNVVRNHEHRVDGSSSVTLVFSICSSVMKPNRWNEEFPIPGDIIRALPPSVKLIAEAKFELLVAMTCDAQRFSMMMNYDSCIFMMNDVSYCIIP